MKKLVSLLAVLALLCTLCTGALAAESAQESTANYETVLPIRYNRITAYSAAHGYFVCDSSTYYDELYSTAGELLLTQTYIELVGDYVYVQTEDGHFKLLDSSLETVLAPEEVSHILLVSETLALVVKSESSDQFSNYYGPRSLYDLTTGNLVQTYESGNEYDEITLPDGTAVKPQEVNDALKPGGGESPYVVHAYSNDTVFNICTSDDQVLATVTAEIAPDVFACGCYAVTDRTGVVYSDEPGHCTLYNLDGEVVIPADTFDSFSGACDDAQCLVVGKDGQYGVIRLPEYTAQETEGSADTDEMAQAVAYGYATEEELTRRSERCTRLEFCQIVARAIRTGDMELTETFSDCDDESVLLAAALGIVSGYPDGTFRPNAYITRQEAAVMLARFAATLNKQPSGEAISFADADQIASWATDAVAYVSALVDSDGHAVMGGIGNNLLSPLGNYTVEQAAVTVLRLMKCQ